MPCQFAHLGRPAYGQIADQLLNGKDVNDAVANAYATLAGRSGSQIDSEGFAYWVEQAYKLGKEQMLENFKASVQAVKGFAVGTNYVEDDTFTKIHKGERIMPAADNTELMRRLRGPEQSAAQSTAALATAMQAMQKRLEKIEESSGKAAQVLEAAASGGAPLMTEVA